MASFKVGTRVRIPTVTSPMRQPHPEQTGKLGIITGSETVEFLGHKVETPVITLDDGSVLKGYECWWEPVKVDEA